MNLDGIDLVARSRALNPYRPPDHIISRLPDFLARTDLPAAAQQDELGCTDFTPSAGNDLPLCWHWSGQPNTSRYQPPFHAGGRRYYPAQFSYLWRIGPVPYGLRAIAVCGDATCLRPRHLGLRRMDARTRIVSALQAEAIARVLLETPSHQGLLTRADVAQAYRIPIEQVGTYVDQAVTLLRNRGIARRLASRTPDEVAHDQHAAWQEDRRERARLKQEDREIQALLAPRKTFGW
jgi:hypothetical protein